MVTLITTPANQVSNIFFFSIVVAYTTHVQDRQSNILFGISFTV